MVRPGRSYFSRWLSLLHVYKPLTLVLSWSIDVRDLLTSSSSMSSSQVDMCTRGPISCARNSYPISFHVSFNVHGTQIQQYSSTAGFAFLYSMSTNLTVLEWITLDDVASHARMILFYFKGFSPSPAFQSNTHSFLNSSGMIT